MTIPWQPILTAPKHQDVLLYAPSCRVEGVFCEERVTVGRWRDEEERSGSEFHANGSYLGEYGTGEIVAEGWTSWDGGFTEQHPPTHWAPMPDGPS